MSTPASTNGKPSGLEPLIVHVENAHEINAKAAPAAAPSPAYVGKYETIVLTANDPVQSLLAEDSSRRIAFVQALDNDVVVGTHGQVAAAANTVSDVPQPQGAYIPKANGSPTPIVDCNAVWVGITTTTSNSRVSVLSFYRQ